MTKGLEQMNFLTGRTALLALFHAQKFLELVYKISKTSVFS